MNGKRSILIAEDEALTALALATELGVLGYDVLMPVATGEDAIKIAKSNKPDIILMDLHLAGSIDGAKAAKEIMVFYDVIVIFMTGYSSEESVDEAKELNPAAILTKPIRAYEIEDVINSYYIENE